MTDIEFFEGEISDVSSDVLITTIHPTDGWFGGTNGDLHRYASEFHRAATAAKPLVGGQVLFVPAAKHRFDVIFVVDDLSLSIDELVAIGLREAEQHDDLHTVTFSVFRTGVTAGIHSERNLSLRLELAAAVSDFIDANTPRITHIAIVYSEKKGWIATKGS